MAYDVGIYTLLSFADGNQIGIGQGKFVVVAVRGMTANGVFRLTATAV